MGAFGFGGISSCRNKKCDCSKASCVSVAVIQQNRKKVLRLKKNPNPDPYKFEIKRVKEYGIFCVVEVVYPNCTTFEGKKILVIKDSNEKEIRALKVLDPHFCEKSAINIFARFKPTMGGFSIACSVADALREFYAT